MKNYQLCFITLFIIGTFILCFTADAFAKIEWEVIDKIELDSNPLDIAISKDGATAYILCKKSIQIYSIRQNKITDIIPVKGDFSQIAISPAGGNLFLTDSQKKQLSIIQISQIYDIDISNSPIIGKTDAPVNVFAFLDYQ